jgi:hypothetical protein
MTMTMTIQIRVMILREAKSYGADLHKEPKEKTYEQKNDRPITGSGWANSDRRLDRTWDGATWHNCGSSTILANI